MPAQPTTARIIANSQINFGTSGARGLVEQFTDDAGAAQAREWSRTHHLDALISTDGDGDRPPVSCNTASDRVQDFPTEESGNLIRQWEENPESFRTVFGLDAAIATIDTIDGLRATLTDDRTIHLRPSGNAPELRCYCEAGSTGSWHPKVNDSITLKPKQVPV